MVSEGPYGRRYGRTFLENELQMNFETSSFLSTGRTVWTAAGLCRQGSSRHGSRPLVQATAMARLQALTVLTVACFLGTSCAYTLAAAPKLIKHDFSLPPKLRGSSARRSPPGILMASHVTYCGGCVIRRADPSEALAAAELAGASSHKGDGIGEVFAAVLEEGGRVVAGGGYAASGNGFGELKFLASDQERLGGKGADQAVEVMTMILLVIERAARSSHMGISKLRANIAPEATLPPGLLLDQGYAETSPSVLTKDLAVRSGKFDSRRGSGDKGAGELLDVIDEDSNVLCVRARKDVENHNLLHRAVGVLVHDREGRIYVHKRSPNKSSNPSCYDMLVGGLVLSGESSIDAARGEVGEELGLVSASPQLLFTTKFMSRKIRCFVDMYRVEYSEGNAIRHDDGEVVWGKFMSLDELQAMMENETFVPGGLACWRALCEQGFDKTFLK